MRLEKLLSLIIITVCLVTFFYSISGYLSPVSDYVSRPDNFISNDLISLQRNKIAVQQRDSDTSMIKFKKAQDYAAADAGEISMPPVRTPKPTIGEKSASKGFSIVGEGLRVPKGKDKNFLFIKTHKCGTSTLVNMFYLFGIRRRLNFVTQPWSRALDIEM